MITFNSKQKIFHLQGQSCSYLLGIAPSGDLHHLHWGALLSPKALAKKTADWKKSPAETGHHISREFHSREFPDFGHNDLRAPAFQIRQADGTRISEFVYLSHRVTEGKPDFGPGPSSAGNGNEGVQTLQVNLIDKLKNHRLELYYTLYPERNILTRRNILRNLGKKPVDLLKISSASLDLPPLTRGLQAEGQALGVLGHGTKSQTDPGPNTYQLVRFPGKWANERRMVEGTLLAGTTRLESRRGIASHEMNPFAMITRGKSNETKGEVYGIALAYSGNWLIEAEVFRTGGVRVNAGLNDFDFQWHLPGSSSFTTPECVMAYSPNGYSQLSLDLHHFAREKVMNGHWQYRPRPILINNWEATYFKFNHDKIMSLARAGKEAGIELMVLDDGWFSKRDDDTTSLGDWFVDKKKLPLGLRGLSDDVHSLGMKFGLWIEPEMISPKSLLYKKHPDWCLHAPGRERKTARSQLVMDMSRADVRDYLFETVGKALEEARVDYVKWDMNRALFEVGNQVLPAHRQEELYHRFMMGVYDLMDRLNKRFPRVLFEGCAGGGARFDFGVMNYHPQIWASDNTDGLDRLFIQYATSFAYPPVAMGAHISSVPNHQTKRSIPLKWRALVAMSGNFGVEADITKWSAKDRKDLTGYIELYKDIRPTIQFGDFYRLESPYESNRASWMFVNPSRTEALVFVFQIKPWKKGEKVKGIKLKGLQPNKTYEIQGEDLKLSGKKLMDGWLPKEFKSVKKTYYCELYRLRVNS